MRFYLEIKSQKSLGGSAKRFSGPDRYVAVQCVPENATPLLEIQEEVAAKRGIIIRYFGEGYSSHTGPRSMLGRAIAKAEDWIAKAEDWIAKERP